MRFVTPTPRGPVGIVGVFAKNDRPYAERVLCLAWPTFRDVKPSKRMYVIANLSKALVLGLQAVSPTWLYYSYLHYRCTPRLLLTTAGMAPLGECTFSSVPGQSFLCKCISAAYISTDIAALLVVPKLPMTTVVHHVSTALLSLYIFPLDLDASPVGQKLMMYGFWSTLAFRCGLGAEGGRGSVSVSARKDHGCAFDRETTSAVALFAPFALNALNTLNALHLPPLTSPASTPFLRCASSIPRRRPFDTWPGCPSSSTSQSAFATGGCTCSGSSTAL